MTTIQIKDDLWWSIVVWEARHKVPALNLCQSSNDGNEFLRLSWPQCQGPEIHAAEMLHVDSKRTLRHLWLEYLLNVFLLLFQVNHFFDFVSLSILWITCYFWGGAAPATIFMSIFVPWVFQTNGAWSFYPYSKWPFIENVNRGIWLPMFSEREELNCSQWVHSEDLIRPWTTSHVFHLCGDDLPPDWNQPRLISCTLLSGDSWPSDSNWFHSSNSQENLLTL